MFEISLQQLLLQQTLREVYFPLQHFAQTVVPVHHQVKPQIKYK